jgi:hypothetical protein
LVMCNYLQRLIYDSFAMHRPPTPLFHRIAINLLLAIRHITCLRTSTSRNKRNLMKSACPLTFSAPRYLPRMFLYRPNEMRITLPSAPKIFSRVCRQRSLRRFGVWRAVDLGFRYLPVTHARSVSDQNADIRRWRRWISD